MSVGTSAASLALTRPFLVRWYISGLIGISVQIPNLHMVSILPHLGKLDFPYCNVASMIESDGDRENVHTKFPVVREARSLGENQSDESKKRRWIEQ